MYEYTNICPNVYEYTNMYMNIPAANSVTSDATPPTIIVCNVHGYV